MFPGGQILYFNIRSMLRDKICSEDQVDVEIQDLTPGSYRSAHWRRRLW
jgi:hypothetical protein